MAALEASLAAVKDEGGSKKDGGKKSTKKSAGREKAGSKS